MLIALIALPLLSETLPPATPIDVRRYVERVELCLHSNGEAPHDAQHGSLHAPGCSRIGADGAALRRRHARDARTLRVLDALARQSAE